MKHSNAVVRVILSFCLVFSFFSLVPIAVAEENTTDDQPFFNEDSSLDTLENEPETDEDNDSDTGIADERTFVDDQSFPLEDVSQENGDPAELSSVGQTFTIDGLNYKVITESNNGNTVELTGPNTLEGIITIPATVEYNDISYKVVSIADYAFANNSNLENVDFSACENLAIGNYAFYKSDITGILTVSAGVRSIGNNAFATTSGTSILMSVIFEGTPTSVGKGAFDGNDLLRNLKFSADATNTFWDVDAFSGIFPYGVVAYPEGARGYIEGTFGTPYLDDWWFLSYATPLSVSMTSPLNEAVISSAAPPTNLTFTFSDTMTPYAALDSNQVVMKPDMVDPSFDGADATNWKSTSTILTVPLSGTLSDGLYTVTLRDFYREADMEKLSDQEFYFTVTSAPVITSDNHASRTAGHTTIFQAEATSAAPITGWALEGAPNGVSIDPSSGVLTFQPTLAVSTYAFTIKASNALFTTDQEFMLTVSSNDVPVTEVRLNRNALSLDIGESETLIASIFPGNATNKNVIWTSSDPSVVTVDHLGAVTAMKIGTAAITATTEDGGFAASCTVTVNDAPTPVPTPDPKPDPIDPKPDPISPDDPRPDPANPVDQKKEPIGVKTGDSLPGLAFAVSAILGIAATTALIARSEQRTARGTDK